MNIYIAKCIETRKFDCVKCRFVVALQVADDAITLHYIHLS